MSEKIPMLMVLATLMYLACAAYGGGGGAECIKKEGDSGHEECLDRITVATFEHLNPICNATGCYATHSNIQVTEFCSIFKIYHDF